MQPTQDRINVRELRIGNWVLDANVPTVIDFSYMSYLIDYPTTHKVSAIPLTEEWIKRFGFEYKYVDDTCGQYVISFSEWGMFAFDVNSEGYSYTGYAATFSTQLKFVHQLQNLFFALTGTELISKPATGDKAEV